MDRSTEIELVRRIFGHLDTRSTAMMDREHLEPVMAYASGQRAHLERQHLFFDQPLVLAQSADLARPRDFLTHDLTGVPIALVRARAGGVRAFLNVCRHRGAKVIQGSGCARSFACPYHAWTYDDEGRLLGMGTTHGFESVDRESHGLTTLPAVERHGLIWVRPTPDAFHVRAARTRARALSSRGRARAAHRGHRSRRTNLRRGHTGPARLLA